MKKLTTLATLLLSFISSAQQFEWMRYSMGNSANTGAHIAVDRAKNSYVTGLLRDTTTFGATTLIEIGNRSDIYLAKYDSSGNFVWVQQIKTLGSDEADGLVVDSVGNCYLTGFTGWTATFGSGSDTVTIPTKGGFDIFIAKYNTNGKLLWVKSPGSKKDDVSKGISIDGAGNIFITGGVSDTILFGEGPNAKVLNVARSAMITAKYDSSGNFKWVQMAKPDIDDRYIATAGIGGYGIGADKYGNAYIAGQNIGDCTFIDSNPVSLSSPLNGDPFIAKYSAAGKLQWVKKGINGNQLFTLTGLNTDENGKSYMSGYFDGTITFDAITINSNDGHILLAKFDSSGNCLWAKAEGKANGGAWEVLAKNNGHCYVTGSVAVPAVFGTGAYQQSLTANTAGSSFVAEYDPSGNLLDLLSFQDLDSYDIDVDETGNKYLVGDGLIYNVNRGNMAVGRIKGNISSIGSNVLETQVRSLEIYPNPTDNCVNISFKADKAPTELRLEIKNIMGQTIYSKSYQELTGELNEKIILGDRSKGIYFIEIITDKSKLVRKIILE